MAYFKRLFLVCWSMWRKADGKWVGLVPWGAKMQWWKSVMERVHVHSITKLSTYTCNMWSMFMCTASQDLVHTHTDKGRSASNNTWNNARNLSNGVQMFSPMRKSCRGKRKTCKQICTLWTKALECSPCRGGTAVSVGVSLWRRAMMVAVFPIRRAGRTMVTWAFVWFVFSWRRSSGLMVVPWWVRSLLLPFWWCRRPKSGSDYTAQHMTTKEV